MQCGVFIVIAALDKSNTSTIREFANDKGNYLPHIAFHLTIDNLRGYRIWNNGWSPKTTTKLMKIFPLFTEYWIQLLLPDVPVHRFEKIIIHRYCPALQTILFD